MAENPLIRLRGVGKVFAKIELPMTPAMVWHELMVTFDDFMAACGFCQALGECPTIVKKLVTAIAWPIPEYFTQLRRYLPDGQHLAGDTFVRNLGNTLTWQIREAAWVLGSYA